ncbi:MAG: dihydrolipoyl dehydrogenase [Bacteroidales bacterium]|nr:dihydrolipoyl dehydrogenase [Bacteroidales bacterium]
MNFDVIIIGSGPGGYVAAIRASQLGMKVAVVEKAELGGICLNWGCIPTKALLKSAEVYSYFQEAKHFGIHISGEIKPDFQSIIQRSREVAQTMSKGIQFLFKKNNIIVFEGYGSLTPDKKVLVQRNNGVTELLEAKHIIIATGARAKELPHIPIDGKKVISYREAMSLSDQPQKLLVIGSGAIGVEFAYFYRMMGTEVYLVEFLPRIIPLEDEEASKELERTFRRMGIRIYTSSEVKEINSNNEKCQVCIKTPKGEEVIEVDQVLSAIGVKANIENIGLAEVGVKTDGEKILVDEFYRTSVPGICAIGDVVPGPALAHVASHEGIVCVEKIAGLPPQPINYQHVPFAIYTHPEIASVGLKEKDALDKGLRIKVGKFPFIANGKAKASGQTTGFAKLVFDEESLELLGATLVGAHATEMISGIVLALKQRVKAHDIVKTIHPHPTLSEAIMEAAAVAEGEVIHL